MNDIVMNDIVSLCWPVLLCLPDWDVPPVGDTCFDLGGGQEGVCAFDVLTLNLATCVSD